MITAIVRFNIPKETTLEQATDAYRGTAPKYQGLPGLVRKYYLYGEEGEVGGVYLWESREQAEAFYNADWKKSRWGNAANTTAKFPADMNE